MNDYLNKNIVKTLGLEKLPREKQEEMLLQIGEAIFTRIMTRVVSEMDEESKTAFDVLLSQNPDTDKMLAFLSAKIPHFNELVEEEIISFKKESSDFMASLDK